MRDRAFAHIGDDLHVAMGMGREAGVGGDLVVIPDPQGAVAHIVGVVVAAEREVMFCLEPAVVGAAEFVERSEFDHGMFLCFELWICAFVRCINRNYRNLSFQNMSSLG